jgi:hypothetical protein
MDERARGRGRGLVMLDKTMTFFLRGLPTEVSSRHGGCISSCERSSLCFDLGRETFTLKSLLVER